MVLARNGNGDSDRNGNGPSPGLGLSVPPHETPTTPKARACVSCRSRKIKCDGKTPVCSTCVAHSRSCDYDKNGPKRRSRVAGSRRDRQERARSLRSSGVTRVEAPQTPNPPLRRPARTANHQRASSKSPEVDVSQHVALGRGGNLEVRGPTNTLYEQQQETQRRDQNAASRGGPIASAGAPGASAAKGAVGGPNAPDPHPYASAILTANAAIERQKEAQYRTELLARGEIEGVPAELALHLLDIHWSRHHFFMLSYRPAFYRDMMNGGKYWSRLLFFSILAVSCRYSEREEVGGGDHAAHSGAAFYETAKQLLMDEMEVSSVPTATALLLLGNALMSAGIVDRGWLYTGMGIRMVISLGLHVEVEGLSSTDDKRTVEDIEIGRRLFWGGYVSEKLQSLYQGRPMFLRGMDCHVPKKFLDVYDEDEIWTPFPSVDNGALPIMATNAVSCFTCHCSLAEICEEIMSSFYPIKVSTATTRGTFRTLRERIRGKLSTWIRDLPAKLRFTPWNDKERVVPIHVIVLHTIYLSLVILSERPFIANGHLATQKDGETEGLKQCTMAAEQIVHMLHAYREAYTFRRVPYQVCYASYVASTILVRNATSATAAESHVSTRNTIQHLAVCLKGFREMKLAHPGTARMEERIRALMDRLDVSVTDQAMTTPENDVSRHHPPLPSYPSITSPNGLPGLYGQFPEQSPAHADGQHSAQSFLGPTTHFAGPVLGGTDGALGDPSSDQMFAGDMNGFNFGANDMFWNFGAQDLGEDILFGAMRDVWA